jgi:hypothetical protein
LDLLGHLKARQARHLYVKKHDLWTMPLEQRQGIHSVGGGSHDPKARPKDGEMAAKLVEQRLLVFRDDRACHD